jgi:anti-repressor protein
VASVNARDLHRAIGNKDEFASWIKDRIKQFQFIERPDFTTYLENSQKGAPRKEYALTIDMAKELAMVELTSQA